MLTALVLLCPGISYSQPPGVSAPPGVSTPSEGLPTAATADYQLDYGDTIQLEALVPEPQSSVQRVDHNGNIVLYPVGNIRIKGLTSEAARLRVEQKLRKYYRAPRVSLRLVQVRTFFVNISGAVPKPGRYLVDGLSGVAELIQKAGGPSAEGSLRRIELRDSKLQVLKTVNYLRWVRQATKGDNPRLEPGQTVYVPVRNQEVRISGSVIYPGAYELLPSETFQEFITAAAGGFQATADLSNVQIARLQPDGQRERMVLDLDQASMANTKAEIGDVITILDRTLKQDSIIVLGELRGVEVSTKSPPVAETTAAEGARSRSMPRMRFRIRGGERVSDVVSILGGPTDMANLSRARIQRRLSGGKLTNIDFALSEAIKSPGGPSDHTLQDGDTLIVAAVPSSVYVIGEVNSPGAIPWKAGLGLREFVALAGGPNRTSTPWETRLIRVKDSPENPSVYRVNLNNFFLDKGYSNLVVEAGDIIFVPREEEPLLKQVTAVVSGLVPLFYLFR